MSDDSPLFTSPATRTASRIVRRSITTAACSLLPIVLFVGVAAAQPNATGGVGGAFCSTSMATTIKNTFTLIQFGGPLIGGVLALGAMVMIPMVGRSDRKQRFKEIRNQGLLYGVLVAPLGTEIIGFVLNNVVAGGSSCAF